MVKATLIPIFFVCIKRQREKEGVKGKVRERGDYQVIFFIKNFIEFILILE